ncbi:MAG TPA: NAD-glutamate dehydrogenase [Beijerinckiaceae bacterium]|nr:NAD-glutamate dehydrogenase [Beijerinckiaceae bacterium]
MAKTGNGSGAMNSLLHSTFEALLYGRVVPEDRAVYPPGALATIAAGALERFGQRKAGGADIHLTDVDGPDGARITVIEAINDDKPFLVASTLAELNERGLDVRLVAHPVLAVRRNDKGELTSLGGLAGAGPDPDFVRESFVHIHVARIVGKAAREALVRSLQEIYRDIGLAVHDWKAMRERLAGVAHRYREHPPMLPADEIAEAVQFLDWLAADNFSFLGMREYRFASLASEPVAGAGLGILSDPEVKVLRRGSELVVTTPEIRAFLSEPSALIITKANVRSRIHRRVHMDYIGVKLIDETGALEGELRLIGLFTSTAYTGSTRTIPYIRHKVAQVMMKAGFDPASHSGKALMNVLESYPRDELFQLDRDTLYGFAMDAMNLNERPRIRALVRADRFDRFVSVIVYVPKDRYDTGVRLRIGDFLARSFDGRVSAAYPSYPEGPLSRTHFIIGRHGGATPKVERSTIEAGIAAVVRTWGDTLKTTIETTHAPDVAETLLARYGSAFSAGYREAFAPAEALADIAILENLSAEQPTAVDLYRAPQAEAGTARLKVYAFGAPIALSRRVPVLENLGFSVSNERTYDLHLPMTAGKAAAYLHDMTIARARNGNIDVDVMEERVEAALMAVFADQTESDRFNTLVVEAGLTWREAMVLRAYGRYLGQAGAPFAQNYLADVLAKYPEIARGLIELFGARFDPERPGDNTARIAAGTAVADRLRAAMDAVSNLDEDRILRRFLNLIEATLRTNYYQRLGSSEMRPALAFKFDPRRIDGLPLPRPQFEIYVHSPRVDGVHMRFGKVARGGLRWSDRPMDFRTEILGLVKAQHVKNSVIVPVGAKGGFVPKRLPPPSDREAWMAEGIAAYKTYINALLDVTDTISGRGIKGPAGVVRLDGDDPYLVVAADKGTATFSDIANAISIERGHWLGDAFASGGSQGYDHKKMGITARGAWECVKRHFREMDIDIQAQPVTVAGVGDMSGDVFGNGMLLSKALRLVAAFDHRDIFLDPDPDPARAHAERQRLFDLPRSSWQDYDRALISKGGGIYSRSAKEIVLSPELRATLKIEAERVTPQELMMAILKAPVDLLWFGGIGTYIRSGEEADVGVGDRANDAIRIPATALNCRVIGEGANLGVTQRGRIEASRRGIRLNTDAIDNSAGVNTSDVEVNLKIALAMPVADGSLGETERNSALAGMTDEVAALVLRNNYLQSLALSLAERRGAAGLAELQRLMQGLESRARLDRAVELLPADTEIARRIAAGEGATRPELAVLLAYAKLSFFDDLIVSEVPYDPYFADELDRYFPLAVRGRFPEAVKNHRLRREIIATQLANIVVNRCGPGGIARLQDETGADIPSIAAAYALTRDAFGLLDLNGAIDQLDTKIPGAVQLDLYAALQDMLVGRLAWVLRNVDLTRPLGPEVRRFKAGIDASRALAPQLITPAQNQRRSERLAEWTGKGVPQTLAMSIVDLPALVTAPDAVLVAEQTGKPVRDVLETLFALADRFNIGRIRQAAATIPARDRFERLAIDRAIDGMDLSLRRLAGEVIAGYGPGMAGVATFAAKRGRAVERITAAIEEIVASGLTQAKLTIAANLLGDLVRS